MKQGDLFGLICVLSVVFLVVNNSRIQDAAPVDKVPVDFVRPLPRPRSSQQNNLPNLHSKDFRSAKDEKVTTIAYAITVTRCDNLLSHMLPGAAVLAELVHNNSVHSKYNYKLYAFLGVTDVTETCESLLGRLGYTTLRKSVPINMSAVAIAHPKYIKDMNLNGCCGASEFLKLWSYTLTEHKAVIHVDLDVLILKPLDDMLDVLLLPPDQRQEQYDRLHVLRDKALFSNSTMQALITRDYSQVPHQKTFKQFRLIPVQGGFFVVKPSMTAFRELCDIVQSVQPRTYTGMGAWDNKMFSAFWGMPQIQGLLAYYYSYRVPGDALELHHCYYNTILGEPKLNGVCATGMDTCDDCRKTPIADVVLAHPVYCHKPWQCIRWHNQRFPRTAPCRHYMSLWTSTRRKLEERWAEKLQWEMSPQDGDMLPEVYNGYCFMNHSFVPMGFQANSLLPKS